MHALELIERSKGGWDCIDWDPPYWDMDGKDRGVRLNRHAKLEANDPIFFADSKEIEMVRQAILEKQADNAVWIIFHSDSHYGQYKYEHVWFKGDAFGAMGAGKQTRNDEYVYIEPYGKDTLSFLPGLPRVLHYPVGVFGSIPRRCYKPEALYRRLYKHVNATHVLDPFAGWGDSIRAACNLGLKIDACDIDEKLDYSEFEQYVPVKQMEIGDYFEVQ